MDSVFGWNGKKHTPPRASGAMRVLPVVVVGSLGAILVVGLAATSFDLLTVGASAFVFFWPMLAGARLALREHARLRKSEAIARHRLQLAHAFRSQEPRPATDASLLNQFFAGTQDLDNAGQPELGARVIVKVARDAHHMRFEPVYSVLASDLPEIKRGSWDLRNWQTTAIRLGILFTFVGLFFALQRVLPILQGADVATAALTGVVTDLALAFGTSIAGLLAALLLQIVAGDVVKSEAALIAALESAILEIQALYSEAIDREPAIASMNHLRGMIDEHRKDLSNTVLNIDKASQGIAAALRAQEERFESRLAELAKGRDALTALAAEQNAHLNGLKNVYASLVQTETKLPTLISDMMARTATTHVEAFSKIDTAVTAATERVIAEVRSGFGAGAVTSLEAVLRDELRAAVTAMDAAAKTQGALAAEALMKSVPTAVAGERDNGVLLLRGANDALGRLERIQRGTRRAGWSLVVIALLAGGLSLMSNWQSFELQARMLFELLMNSSAGLVAPKG
jgi:hypothetical protein